MMKSHHKYPLALIAFLATGAFLVLFSGCSRESDPSGIDPADTVADSGADARLIAGANTPEEMLSRPVKLPSTPPNIFVDRPARLRDYLDAQAVPPTVRFGFSSIDPDSPHGATAEFRYLWKRALYNGQYVRTRYMYDQLVDELVSFADPAWSDWLPYPTDFASRIVTLPNQPMYDETGRMIVYLFALQARSASGTVSVDRTYGRVVHNVYVSSSFSPLLTVNEANLGTDTFTGVNGWREHTIASGQVLQFDWEGTIEDYIGVVAAYQYGWDVADPDDPNDPGWAVLPGNTPQHQQTDPTSFTDGTHTLTIQCWDDIDQLTRATYVLSVVTRQGKDSTCPKQ